MRRWWEHVRSIPGLRRDLITVAVIVAVGVGCGTYIVAQYDWEAPWAKRTMVSADFARTFGVRPQSRQEVRIAGVTVGKIESAEPSTNGRAHLVMSLDPGHIVYSNARAVLRTKSPLNVMYVELNPGGPPAAPLPQNGNIPVTQTDRDIQPSELLDKLDQRTRNAVTSLLDQGAVALAHAPQQLPAGLRATNTTVSTFQPVLQRLQTRRETIRQLVTSLSMISSAVGQNDTRLANLASSLQQTLGVLANRDKELSQTLSQVPGFSKDLKQAMTGTNELTKQLNPTLDALHRSSDKLPAALSRLTKTVDTAGNLVDVAKPVVQKAKPVIADLRPFIGHAESALGDLAPVTAHLPSATARIVPWLNDLAAFVYQTSSAFSVTDHNGGFGRANITLDVMNPAGGLAPQGIPQKGRGGK